MVKTIQYRDSICIDSSWSCADNFEFYAIYEAKHMAPDVDGVLGFGPDSDYLIALVDEGLIPERVFALDLSNNEL